ncbi:hypothetical protein Trydic_g17073 [Trypoxylus dichotomus]
MDERSKQMTDHRPPMYGHEAPPKNNTEDKDFLMLTSLYGMIPKALPQGLNLTEKHGKSFIDSEAGCDTAKITFSGGNTRGTLPSPAGVSRPWSICWFILHSRPRAAHRILSWAMTWRLHVLDIGSIYNNYK